MEQSPPPDPPPQLQRDLYHQVAHDLRAALPPPLADTWEERDRRDRVAIGLAASLSPVNAEEATIAAHFVVANAHAMDCMRQLRETAGTPSPAKLDAQAHRAMREARGARSLLLRVQTARHRREKDDAACAHDAWAEHIAMSLMTETLDQAPPAASIPQPAPVAAPQPPVAAPQPPVAAPVATPSFPDPAPVPAPRQPLTPPDPAPIAAPAPMPAPVAAPPPEATPATPPLPPIPSPPAAPPQAQPSPPLLPPKLVNDDEPILDPAAEAERYAIVYPRRAALIRRVGGLPDDCDFGPPEPELVQAIVIGTSPALRALDSPASRALDSPALRALGSPASAAA